jgi:hypothetical protein
MGARRFGPGCFWASWTARGARSHRGAVVQRTVLVEAGSDSSARKDSRMHLLCGEMPGGTMCGR